MPQFVYTRQEKTMKEGTGVNDIPAEYEEIAVQDSFNTDLVVRSIGSRNGKRLVILNDGFEKTEEMQYKTKAGKVETKRERHYFRSEIELSPEDSVRFIDIVGQK